MRDERYRLYFDGFMNWNKLGFLARKFAAHDVAVIAGRYTHQAFWQEPHLIDPENPITGMAQHYLLCPTNHGAKTIKHLVLRDCEQYGVDGIVFHSTRTCRAFTNPQHLIAKRRPARAGHRVHVLRGRRGRRLVLQGRNPGKPARRHARGHRRPPSSRRCRAGVTGAPGKHERRRR